MEKKIFPGGTTAKMREEARRKKKEQKQAARRHTQEYRKILKEMDQEFKQKKKQEKQKFLNAIGPATRLLMVRRGLVTFVATVALEIEIGSGIWAVDNLDFSPAAKPQEYRREYLASLKSAYNVTNLFDGDKWSRKPGDKASDAIETLFAMLLVGCAIKLARKQYAADVEIAKKVVENDESNHDLMHFLHCLELDNGGFNDLSWKLHPVCRAVIKHMSSQDPRLFNALLAGEIDNATYDFAKTVIGGYLKSHPDHFKKVMDVYDTETMPKSLVRKYGAKTR